MRSKIFAIALAVLMPSSGIAGSATYILGQESVISSYYDVGSEIGRGGSTFSSQAELVGTDLKSIFRAPVEHPKKTLKWVGIIGGLVLVDRPVTQFYQEHVQPALNWKLGSIDPAFHGADGFIVYGVGGQFLGASMFGDVKGRDTAFLAGKSMAYSVLFTHILLKPIFGRNRPSPDLSSCPSTSPPYTCDPYDFGHHYSPQIGSVQGGSAMPSFHFTMYFSVARVYQLSYDNYWVPYGLAALAATSNIYGHHHWVSDMVAGSLLGTLIGTKVYRNYEKAGGGGSESGSRLVMPILDQDRIGISYYARF
jgi:membrane-associated phospholipid phosphatase